jgi:hypothetical protein
VPTGLKGTFTAKVSGVLEPYEGTMKDATFEIK